MNRMKGELIEESIEDGDFPFISRQLQIHLYQDGFDDESIIEQEEYELGVDTARYGFKINEDHIIVSTGGDGFWGSITERKDSEQNPCIDIVLLVPDGYSSSQAFIDNMPALIRENLKEMELIQDYDVDIPLDEHGGEMKQC